MKVEFADYTYYDPTNSEKNKTFTKRYDEVDENTISNINSSGYYSWNPPTINGKKVNIYDRQDNDTEYAINGDYVNIKDYKQYRFDETKFRKYIANGEFEDAADYASKFIPNDPEKRRNHVNSIINLRREGQKYNAIYGSVTNEDDKAKMQFLDHVFLDGGLEQIQDNKYAKKYMQYLKALGTNQIVNNADTNESDSSYITDDASKLAITFSPKKKTGLFGIDWLVEDNARNIDNFYENSGLNEAQLKAAGVKISHREGYTTLTFDKTNKYTARILANIYTNAEDESGFNSIKYLPRNIAGNVPGLGWLIGGKDSVKIEGLDSNGNVIKDTNTMSYTPERIASYINNYTNPLGKDKIDDHDFNNNYYDQYIYQMQKLINDANNVKTKVLEDLNATKKDYSSTVGPLLDDNLAQLQADLANGRIKEEEFWRRFKQEYTYIDEAMRSIGTGNYEMYSNYYNDNDEDKTLVNVDNKNRAKLQDIISAANPSKIHFNSMISNGKIGTLITVDPYNTESNNIVNDLFFKKQIKIFIPGLCHEQAQAKINSNSATRAIQTLNDMQDWNYGFKCEDGEEIYASNGMYYKGEREISKNEAITNINKSLIIEETKANLQFELMNSKGEIIDADKYEQITKIAAINAVNELYPNLPLMDVNGVSLSIEDLFAMRGIGGKVNNDLTHPLRFDITKKIEEMYNIYDKIMDGLTYYNH